MNEAIYGLALVLGFLSGACYGVWFSVRFPYLFATRFWVKVDSENEVHVVETVKSMDMCKKTVVHALPSLLLNEDGSTKYNSPQTVIVIEFGDRWFGRYRSGSDDTISSAMAVQTMLDNVKARIEKRGIKVVECGIY